MDLYPTLWETSFDPNRGHNRTLNEFFYFDANLSWDSVGPRARRATSAFMNST